jgi:hypothetical protein
MFKRILPQTFFIFLSAMLVMDFALKDSMNNYLSKMMVSQAGTKVAKLGPAYVDSTFNY